MTLAYKYWSAYVLEKVDFVASLIKLGHSNSNDNWKDSDSDIIFRNWPRQYMCSTFESKTGVGVCLVYYIHYSLLSKIIKPSNWDQKE